MNRTLIRMGCRLWRNKFRFLNDASSHQPLGAGINAILCNIDQLKLLHGNVRSVSPSRLASLTIIGARRIECVEPSRVHTCCRTLDWLACPVAGTFVADSGPYVDPT